MKRNIFKIMCLVLSLTLVFSFTGCSNSEPDDELSVIEIWEDEDPQTGSSSTGNSSTGNSSTGNSSTGNGSTGNSSSSGNSGTSSGNTDKGAKLQPINNPYGNIPSDVVGQTVTFATWIDHTSNESAQVLKDFTAKTGIKVKILNVAQSGYMTKLVSMIASNNAPDVFVDNSEWPVSLKVAQPLNDYINKDDPVWSKAHLNYGTINKKLYVVNGEKVHWNFVHGVFFNKKVAVENGIKTPYDYRDEGNWNWDTMRQFMKDYSAITGSYYGGYLNVDDLPSTAGTSFVKYNNGTFSSGINDANLTKAIQMYADIKKNEYMMDSNHHVYLKDGTQGLFFGSSWHMTRSAINWQENEEVPMNLDDFGFIEAPGPKGGKAYAKLSTRAYGICKNAKNPVAAGYFLRYFLDGANYDFNTVYKSPNTAKEMINRVKAANDKRTYYIDASEHCFALVNEKLYSTTITEIKETDTAQIAAILKKKSGICDNAAKKSNSLFKSVK